MLIEKELMKDIQNRIRHIPHWVDTKEKFHKIVWKHLRNCTEILVTSILDSKIIEEEDFERFIVFFELELDKIIGFGFDLEVAVHFEMFNDFLLDLMLHNEYYEQAENIKRIMEWYFLIKFDNYYNE